MDKISQEKIQILENSRSTRLEPRLTPKLKKKRLQRNVKTTMVNFQQQNPQCLIDRYKHMDRRHNRVNLRLKVVPLA